MTTTEFTARQYEGAFPPGIGFHFWNSARNAIIARTLSRGGMAGGSLLEIGCGTGVVLEYLRKKGVDCVGCDLADAPVPERLREVVFTRTDFRNLPMETRQRIDGVLLCDVIEHLPDAGSLLADLRTALPRLRRVLLTVPARTELWSSWDDYSGHYRRYDRTTLGRDLRRAGLEPVLMRYFFHALYPVMYALRRSRSDSIAAPRRLLAHRLLAWAFRAEHVLLPCSLPGTSLIVVARVPSA